MAKISCTLAFLLFGAVFAAATNELLTRKSDDSNNPSLGIYKGKTTSIKKHPYLVSSLQSAATVPIRIKNSNIDPKTEDNNAQYFNFDLEHVSILTEGQPHCAGSIVSDSWVLTSADCVDGYLPTDLTVLAGSEDGATGGKSYTLKQVVVHPSYGSAFLDYDYGLLQIKGKFKWSDTVKSVKLPKKAAKAGSKVVAVGWGSTSEGEDGTLKQGKQTVLSLKECEKIYDGFGLDFTDRMICTYNKGKVTLCDGDWADPITEKNVQYSLFVAIGTAGECTGDALPVIGANVKTAVPWIQNVTGLADY